MPVPRRPSGARSGVSTGVRQRLAGTAAVAGPAALAADQRRRRAARYQSTKDPAIVPTIGGIAASGVAPARVTIAATESPPAITRAMTPSGGRRYCRRPATAEATSTAEREAHEQGDLVVFAEGRDRELLERLRHDVDHEGADGEDRTALARDEQRDQFCGREEDPGTHDARDGRPEPELQSAGLLLRHRQASASAGFPPVFPLFAAEPRSDCPARVRDASRERRGSRIA